MLGNLLKRVMYDQNCQEVSIILHLKICHYNMFIWIKNSNWFEFSKGYILFTNTTLIYSF